MYLTTAERLGAYFSRGLSNLTKNKAYSESHRHHYREKSFQLMQMHRTPYKLSKKKHPILMLSFENPGASINNYAKDGGPGVV